MKNYFLLPLAFFISVPVFAAKMVMPSYIPPAYENECASCHMAYPPSLLGQKNWQSIMSNLNRHFGTDASVDAKVQSEISQWLIKNSATKKKYSLFVPSNRITKSVWFISEHDELSADVWKRAGVKSQANCLACHTDAATGAFSENTIRIPPK
jgi:nitrate/TMAO reductase-like tetraheme cytochrome c subunit